MGEVNKSGYKQTEVGLIPEEWEVKKIEELGELDSDNLSSSTNPGFQFCYISLEDVKQGNLQSFSELRFRNAPSRARRKLKKDDLLISTVRPNLKSHLLFKVESSKEWICSTGFSVLRCDRSICNSEFVYNHFFDATINKQIDNLITGSNYPAISSREVKSLLIPLPPLPEQTAIASALSDMDALIAQTEKLIEKKKAIKQGVMQELLTGKKRLKGFENSKGYKQTEVGLIPEDWECVKLKKVIKSMPDYGIGAAAVEFSLNLPVYLRITDISEDGDFLKSNISSVNSDQSRNYILGKGEVVVARTGASVGKTYLYNPNDGELVFAGFLIRIKPDEQRLNSEFLFCLTQSKYYKDWIVTNSMRSGQPGINSAQISNLNIPLPPIEEQKSIAGSIIDINNEIKVLDRRIEKLKLQKQGMMQALLTGKIRLV